ncbi:MAG: hypothetical protein M1818_004375 [Claussenomyces sp. TS43310]|nr:MAG: hypothetical protein M1818_004375 [Claussenomyces sp. TS43310]
MLSQPAGDASPFTCATCVAKFTSNAIQRNHMHSDWHVYNLKRRIASLPPLSSQVFAEQVLAAQKIPKEEGASTGASCSICSKNYATTRHYKNHLKNQNHARNVVKLDSSGSLVGAKQSIPAPTSVSPEGQPSSEELDTNEDDSTEEEEEKDDETEFNPLECLFCGSEHSSLDDNMHHMHRIHGMFIPNQDYLIDLESFISFLSFLVLEVHECLYCGTIKSTIEGIRHHMTDKGHCRINLDQTSNLAEFYDFPPSNYDSHRTLLHAEEREKDPELGLRLGSSGRTLQHRFANRRHHQPAQAATSPSQRLLTDAAASRQTPSPQLSSSKQLTSRASDTRSLIGIPEQQQRALRIVEKKMLKMELRARNEYQRKVERGGNQQKHFKPDVPGPSNG